MVAETAGRQVQAMSGRRVCTRLFWRHARQLAQQQRTPFVSCGSSPASASSASTFRSASTIGGAHRVSSAWPFAPSSSCSSSSTALRCFGSSGSAAAPAASQATPAVTEAAHASSPASTSGRDGAASEGPQRHVYATKGYGSHPPPRRGSVPLWTEDAIPRLPRLPLQRRIFCNRALNMKQIKAVGYDMDYTLAQYKPDTFEGLAHKETVSKLIEVFRYPEELRGLDFQWDYMTKGLIIDKERGNMLKVDRHNYVKVAYHGFEELSAEKRKAIYNAHQSTHSGGGGVFEEAGGYAMVDTLFSLAEAYLYMQLVDMKDKSSSSSSGSNGTVKPGFEVLQRKSYKDLYRDLRTAVDMCHRDGSLKRAVAANPEKFIHRDENLVHVLETQRAAGRTLFLATNSLFDYTNVVMNFLLLGKTGSQKTSDWLKYFDVVMVGCAKPSFFQHRAPLFSVDVNTGMLRNTDNGAPIIPIDEQDMSPTVDVPGVAGGGAGGEAAALRNPALAAATGAAALRPGAGAGLRAAALGCGGNVFQGGWYGDLHKMLGVTEGSQVLYIGDHIYGDIVKSKKDIGWRTMLVVPELELELEKAGRSAKMADELRQLRQLRDEYDDRIQRLKWSIAQSGAAAAAGGGASKGPEAEEATRDAQQLLEAAEVDRAQLKARHSALLRAHHKQFHPIWGQLMKTGHQNSRFAHQIERYACLYTSHVSNLAFFSPDKSWMGRMDVMAHEAEGEVWDAVDVGLDGPGTPPSGGEMDVGV